MLHVNRLKALQPHADTQTESNHTLPVIPCVHAEPVCPSRD